MKYVLGITLGFLFFLTTVLVLLVLFPDQIEKLVTPNQVRITEINLGETKLVQKYIYAEKDIAIKVLGNEPRAFGLLDSQRLYLATARCYAGIDYTRQGFTVVERTIDAIFIRIPQPQLFECGIISSEFWDGRGFFAASTELTNKLLQVGNEEINRRALQSDMIDKARENAQDAAELDLRRLGFQTVRVEIVPGNER